MAKKVNFKTIFNKKWQKNQFQNNNLQKKNSSITNNNIEIDFIV